MRQRKKYLFGALLIIAVVCILFVIAINRHKEISKNADVRMPLQQKEMSAFLKNRQEKIYHEKNRKDPQTKAINRNEKLLSILKTADIPESVKDQIADYIAETNITQTSFHAKSFLNRDIDNTEKIEVPTPHFNKFTKNYNISSSQWKPLLESFQIVHNPGNEQEMTYKSSRLMDMGTTMLLNKDYKSAEDAFLSVIQMNGNHCQDVTKWAKAGLIRSLEGQGRNDEAMNEKDITLNLCEKDTEFISFLKR